MRAMRTAATGLVAQQRHVDIIANNLANVNTSGFKRSRADFVDLLYQQLRGHAAIKGYKPGWAFFKYQEKFKEEPLYEWNSLPEMIPGEALKRWIKSRLIAYHKARNG